MGVKAECFVFLFKEEGRNEGSLKEAIRNISHKITYLPSNFMTYRHGRQNSHHLRGLQGSMATGEEQEDKRNID